MHDLINALIWIVTFVMGVAIARAIYQQRAEPPMRIFLYMVMSLGVAVVRNMLWSIVHLAEISLLPPGAAPWSNALHRLWPLDDAAMTFFSALWLHFFLTFPMRHALLKRRYTLVAIYAPATLLMLMWLSLIVLPQDRQPSTQLLAPLQIIYIVTMWSLGLIVLLRSYRGTTSPILRAQVHWLAWGIGAAMTLALLTNLLPDAFDLSPPGSRVAGLDQSPVLILMITFSIGLVRYRGPNINTFIRNSIIYSLLALALIALYPLLNYLLARVIAVTAWQFPLALSLAMVGSTLPLLRLIQSGVDWVLYRQQENYGRLLNQFSQQLGQVKTLAELLEKISAAVEQALQPDGLALILRKGNTLAVEKNSGLALSGSARYLLDSALPAWLASQRRPLHLPVETEWLFSLSESERRAIEATGASLHIPFLDGEHLNGWLALGPRRALGAYSKDDLDFLSALAAQVNVALHVTRLIGELEQRVSQLSVLNETGQILGSSLRTQELLEKIHQQVGRLTDARNLYVALYDAESDRVSFPLALENNQRQNWASRQAGRGLTEYIIRQRRPLLIKHGQDDLGQLDVELIGTPARSWLGVPMIANEQAIGVIAVQNFERDEAYTQDDLDILSTIAAQAAVAIANARLYEQIDRALAIREQELAARNQQLDEILRLGNALKANLEPDRILNQVVQAVSSSLGFRVVIITLRYEATQPYLSPAAAVGIPPAEWSRLQERRIPPEALADLMRNEFRLGQSYLIRQQATPFAFHRPDASAALDRAAQQEWLPGDILFIPLTDTHGKLLGLLSVEEPADERLPAPETIKTLQVFANQAAITIENARLFRERAQRISNLSKLYQASLALTFDTEIQDVLEQICSLAHEVTDADSATIYLYNAQTDSFNLAALWGQDLPSDRGANIRPTGMTRRAVKERRSFVIADTELEPDLNPTLRQTDIRSIICTPLISKGKVRGVLYVNSKQANKFDADKVQLVSALASQAAIAIENSLLFKTLTEGGERLQAVLDATREGIMMLDTSGRIVFANAMFGALFDTTASELTGRKLLEVITEQASPPSETLTAMMDVIYETLGELAERNDTVHKSNVVVAHPPRYIERTSAPVFNKAGLAIGRLLMLRDITEEKKAETLREDLIRMMVHDLRSPLTSVLGSLQVLETTLQDAYSRQAVRIASSGSHRLLDLINALLDISKMEAGQMPLKKQPIKWPRLVSEALERVKSIAASEEVSIQPQLAPGLPTVEADESVLLRVLINLLDNALKFSPAGATITISVTASRPSNAPSVPHTLCQVIDEGPGIPPEYQQRIFEKFFQVPDSSGKRRGSGLGLAFCRLAIEAHGGRIWVESIPGHGSTFAFTLPARPTP